MKVFIKYFGLIFIFIVVVILGGQSIVDVINKHTGYHSGIDFKARITQDTINSRQYELTITNKLSYEIAVATILIRYKGPSDFILSNLTVEALPKDDSSTILQPNKNTIFIATVPKISDIEQMENYDKNNLIIEIKAAIAGGSPSVIYERAEVTVSD